MSEYKNYNSGNNKTMAKKGRKQALIQSILKWRAMAAVSQAELNNFWHSSCALCEKYIGTGRGCISCPIWCNKYSAWDKAETAHALWYSEYITTIGVTANSTKLFRRWRKRACLMLNELEAVYQKLYPGELGIIGELKDDS